MLARTTLPGLAVALAGTAATALAWRCREFARCARIGEALAGRAVAFARDAGPGAPRVLVLGDSTGVGTGAGRAQQSVAGCLAAQFPHVTIVNRARNGARVLDTLMQLVDEGVERYDAILVHAGGNDVLRGTPLRALAPQVDALMARACRMSAHVIVTTTPNVGLAPAFFPPLSWWFSRRSRRIGELFAAAACRHGAHYVNFFHPRATDPFSRRWRHYFAGDRLHPSAACYRFVYEALLASTPLAAALAPEPPITVRTSISSGKNDASSA
jgi:lysophospholipase L1-like esterase